MPLNIPDKLPAIELLQEENIFVIDETRAAHQDIRPLKIAILNLMPLKISTETDIIRLLSNSPLQIELDLIKLSTHVTKNTSAEHMQTFYRDFRQIRNQKYDGLIITGAPVEQIAFEDVSYWEELTGILDWARINATSSIFICWGAQAALYHYYNVPKYRLDKKMFGVFRQSVCDPKHPLFRGFDDFFFTPHSRHTEIRKSDIARVENLRILSESDISGINIAASKDGREFFFTGHAEYSPGTLDMEFRRDKSRNLPIDIPANYYHDNNPDNAPQVTWRSHANLLFINWLNYFVYQITPFNIETIE